ncbi:unnamed protein product [Urochloa humidicola]
MQGSSSTGNGSGRVQVITWRVVRAEPPAPPASEEIHLTPWDLRMLTLEYIQNGILLPKPSHEHPEVVVDRLASAFATVLGCFYPFAGRLVLGERDTDGAIDAMSLRCTGEGAEFVHAAAPSVTAADITAWAPQRMPRELVSSLFPLNGILCVDAAASPGGSRRAAPPLLAAQVTELADAVFVAVSLNHAAGDGTTFWHFVNTWSYLSRGGGGAGSDGERPAPPPPVLKRWFLDGYPVPVPLQFAKVEHAVRQCRPPPPLQECSFHFSGESVRKLKAERRRPNTGAAILFTNGASSREGWLR